MTLPNYGNDESITLDELISNFPGRRGQIFELIRLLGPINSPIFPLLIYGGASVGKTSVVLEIFRHMRRPFVYSSCITCYNPRLLFESTLNQLLLHRKTGSNEYSSAKRCERPSDFVNFLKDALNNVIYTLKKGNLGKSSSKKTASGRPKGEMVYLIFDNIEFVRDWDKSSNILPFLFKLHDILKLPEVGLIFISRASPDTYYADTGFVEPIPVYFPDYTEDDLRKILMKDVTNKKLYSSFLELVLSPFYRITRRVNELSAAFSPLFTKYCEPLDDLEAVPNQNLKRKLFDHLRPYISPSLNEVFRAVPSSGTSANNGDNRRKDNAGKLGKCDSSAELDFHMSTSAKYLLISGFLASRNPATLDASLFDSTGGSDNRKRTRKSSEKSMEQKETAEQKLLVKGPGTFPLERLLAIFQCLASFEEYSTVEESETDGGIGGDSLHSELMSDVLLQLSSLCNANFISKGSSCPLEGSTRYRSTVSEDLALKVARSLKFPVSKYIRR